MLLSEFTNVSGVGMVLSVDFCGAECNDEHYENEDADDDKGKDVLGCSE